MTTNEVSLLLAVAAPTVGCFALPVVNLASTKVRNALALALVCVSLACSLALIAPAMAGEITTLSLKIVPGFNFILQADALAVFMACVSSFISAIIVFYSTSYISHYDHQNDYYVMVVLFLGAMMGLVYSGSLILLYVFWEITAIASWRLIGFFRDKRDVIRADKAFLVTVIGALAMLLGFIMLGVQAGSMDLPAIRHALGGAPVRDLAVGLILLGILSKSATLPFHTWLPDAGVAPSPVTALLHAAVLVKIGVYVFARLFVVSLPLAAHWNTIVLMIAAASALVSAGAALIDTDIKRIIAYSTVSQIAFIFLGLASGSSFGVAGALLYILMHGIAKGGLFLCAGIVEQNTHVKDITRMGGLIRTMPITAVSFLLCAASVMGIPPFGGFFGKYMVIGGAIQNGQFWIGLTFLIGAFLTILYMMRLFNAVFMGASRLEHPAREGSAVMVGSVAFLAALALLSGLVINPPTQLVKEALARAFGS